MGQQKDLAEKTLESYNDVFADIANVLLFDGRHVISEGELQEADPRSQYKTDSSYHELERDVAKYWRRQGIKLAFLGYENQSEEDSDIPLRGGLFLAAADKRKL